MLIENQEQWDLISLNHNQFHDSRIVQIISKACNDKHRWDITIFLILERYITDGDSEIYNIEISVKSCSVFSINYDITTNALFCGISDSIQAKIGRYCEIVFDVPDNLFPHQDYMIRLIGEDVIVDSHACGSPQKF